MKIYIGADHRGFENKRLILEYLKSQGHQVIDLGAAGLDGDDDFPFFAKGVAQAVLGDQTARGILLCGSGQGMAMAANRFKGVRASLCADVNDAFSSRHDDDANVLCLSADKLRFEDSQQIISVWLGTDFSGEERFKRRLSELDQLG